MFWGERNSGLIAQKAASSTTSEDEGPEFLAWPPGGGRSIDVPMAGPLRRGRARRLRRRRPVEPYLPDRILS